LWFKRGTMTWGRKAEVEGTGICRHCCRVTESSQPAGRARNQTERRKKGGGGLTSLLKKQKRFGVNLFFARRGPSSAEHHEPMEPKRGEEAQKEKCFESTYFRLKKKGRAKSSLGQKRRMKTLYRTYKEWGGRGVPARSRTSSKWVGGPMEGATIHKFC